MKNKFQRLSKEEKKKAIDNYYATVAGEEDKKRFKRIMIYGILCLIYGTYLIVEQIITKISIANYILGGLLLIAGCVFLIGRHKIIVKKVNDFIVRKK